jgi:DNA-binding XRE family transcriptional regulator
MSPRHLRGMTGVSLSAMAKALGLSEPTLRILEATPLESWTLAQLARYCAACGHVVRIVATDRDGRETVLT